MDKQIGLLIEASAVLESSANASLKYEQLMSLARGSRILQEILIVAALRNSSEKYAELLMMNSKCRDGYDEYPKSIDGLVEEITNRVLNPRKLMSVSSTALTLSLLIAHPATLGLDKRYINKLLRAARIDTNILEGIPLGYFGSLKNTNKETCVICQRSLEHGVRTDDNRLVCLKCVSTIKEFIENRSQSFEIPINYLNFQHLVKRNDRAKSSFRLGEWQVEVVDGAVKVKPDGVLRVPLPFEEYQKTISY